jgi:hypothetical protein
MPEINLEDLVKAINLVQAGQQTHNVRALAIPPPENFQFFGEVDFADWQSRFDRYRVLSKSAQCSEQEQIQNYLYIMGPQAEMRVSKC